MGFIHWFQHNIVYKAKGAVQTPPPSLTHIPALGESLKFPVSLSPVHSGDSASPTSEAPVWEASDSACSWAK